MVADLDSVACCKFTLGFDSMFSALVVIVVVDAGATFESTRCGMAFAAGASTLAATGAGATVLRLPLEQRFGLRCSMIARESHAPKSGNRFGKFQLNVTAYIFVILRLHNLADHFFLVFSLVRNNNCPAATRTPGESLRRCRRPARSASFRKRVRVCRCLRRYGRHSQ